jgi:RNA-directed DNA polymerase
MVAGSREHVEALRDEAAAVLASMGLRLSEEKTAITHIDEGFDFLGFHIQRKRKQGTQRRTLYIYPSKAALAAVKAKVRVLTQGNTNQTLANLLQRVNPVLRGWANYFRHGVSAKTFDYLNAFSWRRVVLADTLDEHGGDALCGEGIGTCRGRWWGLSALCRRSGPGDLEGRPC